MVDEIFLVASDGLGYWLVHVYDDGDFAVAALSQPNVLELFHESQ